ncbi:uncharacterized protein LOC142334130 isoform X1 [Lycorma delicatula]|uniref:uncharacterized protein LOC142334130 isoform X1 n=1 Tax=Lycorma delicatula TaxID=130591 RepID=UPI003F50EEEB
MINLRFASALAYYLSGLEFTFLKEEKMVYIKFVLIILLSVVYYNEANNKFSLDKDDWKRYYLTTKKYITDIIYTQDLYHTQRSCYLCILNEINRQLEIIKIMYYETSPFVEKFKTEMNNFKNNYGGFVLSCEKGMPTDITLSFFEMYSTAHYKASFQKNYTFHVRSCIKTFSSNIIRYTEFEKIRQRYEDDYLSYMILQTQPEVDKLNKNCLICIRDYVDFEKGRWIEIEPHLRPKVEYNTLLNGNHNFLTSKLEYWAVLTDIYTNYQRYTKKVQTWITTCLSNSTNDVTKEFESGPSFQKEKPLISHGKSERMEECISYYIAKVKYSNLLASRGKTVTAGDQVEFKPTDLIKLTTDL